MNLLYLHLFFLNNSTKPYIQRSPNSYIQKENNIDIHLIMIHQQTDGYESYGDALNENQ